MINKKSSEKFEGAKIKKSLKRALGEKIKSKGHNLDKKMGADINLKSCLKT